MALPSAAEPFTAESAAELPRSNREIRTDPTKDQMVFRRSATTGDVRAVYLASPDQLAKSGKRISYEIVASPDGTIDPEGDLVSKAMSEKDLHPEVQAQLEAEYYASLVPSPEPEVSLRSGDDDDTTFQKEVNMRSREIVAGPEAHEQLKAEVAEDLGEEAAKDAPVVVSYEDPQQSIESEEPAAQEPEAVPGQIDEQAAEESEPEPAGQEEERGSKLKEISRELEGHKRTLHERAERVDAEMRKFLRAAVPLDEARMIMGKVEYGDWTADMAYGRFDEIDRDLLRARDSLKNVAQDGLSELSKEAIALKSSLETVLEEEREITEDDEGTHARQAVIVESIMTVKQCIDELAAQEKSAQETLLTVMASVNLVHDAMMRSGLSGFNVGEMREPIMALSGLLESQTGINLVTRKVDELIGQLDSQLR